MKEEEWGKVRQEKVKEEPGEEGRKCGKRTEGERRISCVASPNTRKWEGEGIWRKRKNERRGGGRRGEEEGEGGGGERRRGRRGEEGEEEGEGRRGKEEGEEGEEGEESEQLTITSRLETESLQSESFKLSES
jgi:hypothetical protein